MQHGWANQKREGILSLKLPDLPAASALTAASAPCTGRTEPCLPSVSVEDEQRKPNSLFKKTSVDVVQFFLSFPSRTRSCRLKTSVSRPPVTCCG